MTDSTQPAAPAERLPAPDRILRRKEVEHRIGLSCSALYRRIAAGTFPAPLDLGGNAVGWRESTIEHWLDTRPARTN
jgi:prophage regulatory protein